ncbi:MAG: MarR family transcriptional regulator [Rhodospirillaceae bacterium]|nr:MarR family transcriptional regulator [Rhodospirillaceae bacterium]
MGRRLHCLQFALGLNPAQWEALRFLSRANRYSRTPSALAEYLQTTKGTASQTLKSLEAKGYVRRVPVPEDRRAVRIDITDSGHAVLRRDPLHCLEAAAESLGPDLDAVTCGMSKLVAALDKANEDRSFGLCGECTFFCKNASAEEVGGPHRCALHEEPLSATDATKICVSHRG